MNDKRLFEEKIVPERKLSKWELAERHAVARKHGARLHNQALSKNYNHIYKDYRPQKQT